MLCRFLLSRSTTWPKQSTRQLPAPCSPIPLQCLTLVFEFWLDAMHLASLSRVSFGTRSLKCENSEMGYCFPYSILCLARLEQHIRPPFFFCSLIPLQYSGLVCHILRLVHDSHQPHSTNLKEQHLRLFLFPYFVHTWDHFTFLWNFCPTPPLSQHFALSKN